MDSVNHFQIPVDYFKRTEDFYHKIFGWQTNKPPELKEDFRLINTIENKDEDLKSSQSINGDFFKLGINGQRDLSIVIKFPSIDPCLKKIEDNGGKTVKNKMEILDDCCAQFYNAEGNRIRPLARQRK